MCASVAHDAADRVQAISARYKRTAWFETQVAFSQVRIVLGDVWRVGNDQVEARLAKRHAPVALPKIDVRQMQAIGIVAGNGERRLALVRRQHTGVGSRLRDRQCDGT